MRKKGTDWSRIGFLGLCGGMVIDGIFFMVAAMAALSQQLWVPLLVVLTIFGLLYSFFYKLLKEFC